MSKSLQTDSAAVVLDALEHDKTAFLSGSRNNDVCNWVFLVMILNRDIGLIELLNAFESLKDRLTYDQAMNLDSWSEHYADKISIVYNKYSVYSDDYIKNHLWIDQGGYTPSI